MLPRGLFLSAVSLLLLCVGSAGEPIVRLRRRARVAAAYNRTPALGPIRRSQQPLGKRAPRDWREPQGGVEVPQDIDQRRRKESWYPQFPPCNGSPFPVLKYPGRDPRKWPCKQYPLPPEAARFLDVTAADVRPPVNATYPGYLFVLGTAYGGTTALLGLLSSSPKVTIPDAGWAHEGHWQLVKYNTFPFLKRSGMTYTAGMTAWADMRYDNTLNMEEAAWALHQGWDAAKPIKVDKSHFLISVASQLYQTFRAKGSMVKFIVLVRHPCTYGNQLKRIDEHIRRMREFRRVLEDHRGDILLVLYEELVRDPQGTADKILRFYPELESLDITRTNLSSKSTTLPNGNADRGMAIGGENNKELYEKYVTHKMERVGNMGQFKLGWCEGFPEARKEILNDEGLELLRFFGQIQ